MFSRFSDVDNYSRKNGNDEISEGKIVKRKKYFGSFEFDDLTYYSTTKPRRHRVSSLQKTLSDTLCLRGFVALICINSFYIVK